VASRCEGCCKGGDALGVRRLALQSGGQNCLSCVHVLFIRFALHELHAATRPRHLTFANDKRGTRELTLANGCWILRPKFTVYVGIALTVNFSRELDATFLPSD
jgi:hypothetical protein